MRNNNEIIYGNRGKIPKQYGIKTERSTKEITKVKLKDKAKKETICIVLNQFVGFR